MIMTILLTRKDWHLVELTWDTGTQRLVVRNDCGLLTEFPAVSCTCASASEAEAPDRDYLMKIATVMGE